VYFEIETTTSSSTTTSTSSSTTTTTTTTTSTAAAATTTTTTTTVTATAVNMDNHYEYPERKVNREIKNNGGNQIDKESILSINEDNRKNGIKITFNRETKVLKFRYGVSFISVDQAKSSLM
jgi:putative alpha-1,2-mannosidase